MDWSSNKLIQTTILGLLLGIGFVIPALWPLGLLGVAGVFYLCIYAAASVFQVWWIFWIKSLVVGVWIWSVYPIDWLGFSLGWVELPIIAFYWITISAALAIGGISLLLAIRLLQRHISIRWLYVAAPCVWLVAELVQSIVFSIFLYGPGGQIGATYSMGYIGYLFSEHELLIKLASIGGVYSLSLVFVAVALILMHLYMYQRYVVIGVATTILITSSVWTASSQTIAGPGYKIVTIDTQTPVESELYPEVMQSAIEAVVVTAKKLDPDYILLPEDSRYFDQSLDTQTLSALVAFWQSDTEAIIIDSGRVRSTDESESYFLQTAIYDGQSKELFQSQKRYLVPQGEFLPYGYSFIFTLLGQAESSQMLQDRLSYRVGPNIRQSHYSQKIPAVLFCFEVVDPRGVQKILRERNGTVPFVAHIVSHAWIHPSSIFRQQLQSQLRVQAIWADTYIVIAGNHIPGYTITPAGAILYGETIEKGQYATAKVIEIPVRE